MFVRPVEDRRIKRDPRTTAQTTHVLLSLIRQVQVQVEIEDKRVVIPSYLNFFSYRIRPYEPNSRCQNFRTKLIYGMKKHYVHLSAKRTVRDSGSELGFFSF